MRKSAAEEQQQQQLWISYLSKVDFFTSCTFALSRIFFSCRSYLTLRTGHGDKQSAGKLFSV
ncbi:hypothetical protein LSTR_LSTR006687 [Laodelphax striatellus]|uniref:Uncharacterized protein n=1 Tax=Laodelphax striatellus TaxID=195883 RepID=A0A482X8G7_LAOST|nr:hypothetical protein LSTR_LSTR006687 [Laodelphax striatellus]